MGKHTYLKEFAIEQRALNGLDPNNPPLSITDIARKAKEEFSLEDDVEAIRRNISRELNKEESQEAQAEVHVQVIDKPVNRINSPVTYIEESSKLRINHFNEPGNYVVLGCMHVPGHNVPMFNGITKMLGDIRDLKGLMLIGDFLDLNCLSGHDTGKFPAVKGMTLEKEYEAGRKALGQLLQPLPRNVDKLYLYGNHEDRWNRYMSNMQAAKTPISSPSEALKLEEKGFNVFTNWSSDYVKLGNHLELIHGQYYNTHSAKQHIDKFRGSVMYAHTHRIQMYIEGSTGGFNIGWGGDKTHPIFNYAERGTKNQWQNGFAVVTVDEDGAYFVQQIFVNNDKFYFNGKIYN